ncbi:MAG: ATP-dependent metallopeptidase FtsH/Yme1/Tma family protein, partial [Betaproteobacteria bacterium]
MNNVMKQVLVWLVIALVVFTVFKQFDNRTGRSQSLAYSEFMDQAKSGRIKSAEIEGNNIVGKTVDDKLISTYNPNDLWVVGDLMKFGVKVEGKARDENHLLSILVNWFPMLLLIGVWVFFMRQMQGGGKGGAFSFGKSKAKILDESNNTVTFA